VTAEEQAAIDAAAAKAADEAKTAADAAASAGTDDRDAQIARLEAAVKAANKEAETRRRKLKDLEDADVTRQQAELSETDRLKAELDAAKKAIEVANEKARDMLIRSAFVAEAAKLGAQHPEDVYVLADKAGVDVNESGVVEGVADAVKALVDAGRVTLGGKPRAPELNSGAGGGERSSGSTQLTAGEIEAARLMGIPIERAQAQKAALIAEQQAL